MTRIHRRVWYQVHSWYIRRLTDMPLCIVSTGSKGKRILLVAIKICQVERLSKRCTVSLTFGEGQIEGRRVLT
jgi:hypothetical protein